MASRDAINEIKRMELLRLVEKGAPLLASLDSEIKRSRSWYNAQRRAFPEWASQIDYLRTGDGEGVPADLLSLRAGDFPDFCRKYLGQRLFWHQLQWYDLLQGRAPRDLHEAEIYEPGDPGFILVNTPPEHAKTTTLSINYPLWRLCADPNQRIILVSKTQEMAKTFVYAIKNRLTHPRYRALQMDFAPPGGWKDSAEMWTSARVYLGGDARDSGEKDPTIQAIGIGQQVYGARADLVIVDDSVVLSNAHEFEKQIRWLQQEVLTRLGDTGRLLVVGTRVDSMDLYRALREDDRYPVGKSPWTYLAQPAVLSYAEDPKEWVTLWPRTDTPWAGKAERPDADGLFTRWDGRTIGRRRSLLAPRTWALAYQQGDVEEDSVFPAHHVRAAINGMRSPGVMHAGAVGYRPKGMDGLYVVAGLDPAMAGDTGITVIGLDRHTGIRHILDCRIRTGATPTWIRETVKEITELLAVHEWRIESNAFQSFLSQDPELHQYLANLGVIITEHHTGKNKWDVGYGVASMAPLFINNLVELPNISKSEAVRQLVDQLICWSPESKTQKTDMVMSMWFAEIKCRELMQASLASRTGQGFMPNRFLSRGRKSQRHVVHLSDLASYSRAG